MAVAESSQLPSQRRKGRRVNALPIDEQRIAPLPPYHQPEPAGAGKAGTLDVDRLAVATGQIDAIAALPVPLQAPRSLRTTQ